MKKNGTRHGINKAFLSHFLILTTTVTLLSSGAFGLVPNSPFEQQYIDLVSTVAPPVLLRPINQFLALLDVPPIPENHDANQNNHQPLDPGGWILEQFGADLPPIETEGGKEAVLDPAGVIFEAAGIETETLPQPEIPRDPIGTMASFFGVELINESELLEYPPLDPAGLFLSTFIKEEYLYPSETAILDPGGAFLGLFFEQNSLALTDPILAYNALLDPISLLSGSQPNTAGYSAPFSIQEFNVFSFMGDFLINEETALGSNAQSSLLQQAVFPSTATTTLPAPTTSQPTNTVTSQPATFTPQATQTVLVYYAPPTATQAPPDPPTPTPTTPPVTSAIVNSAADPGTDTICNATECTLREAVTLLSAGGTITFDPSLAGATINLTSVLNIPGSLTINGGSLSPRLTINGSSANPIFIVNSGNISLYSLTFTNGLSAGNGGAIIFNGGNLTLHTCNFSGNTGYNGGAIYHNSTGYLSITHSTFFGNYANGSGGAIYENGTGHLYVQYSRFTSNSSTFDGAGIYSVGSAVVDIQNSIFASNTSSNNGGGIFFASNTPQLRNSTLWSNSAANLGGGIYNGADLSMWNNILWNNSGSQVYDVGGAVIDYNNIQGGGSGTNIDSDPLFVNAAGGDFSLNTMPLSPSIDTGNTAKCTAGSINGATRPINICDMGAYEQ